MDDTVTTLQPGQYVGPFEILRQMHSGGQAVVYLARLQQPDQNAWPELLRRLAWQGATPALINQQKLCVLKVAYPDQKDTLLHEWNYLSNAQVKHERMIKTFSERFGNVISTRHRRQLDMAFVELTSKTGNAIQVPYIALAYESGGSLKQEMERRNYKPFRPGCAVQIAIQIGEALQHLHEQARLVHHDISPSNILLRKSAAPLTRSKPDAILIDLAAADSLDRPRQRHKYGKWKYIPPERRYANAPLSPQIDIYSLGMVLYELLVGRLPDTTTTSGQSVSSRHPLQSVREQNRRVSEELNDLVMQAIEHDADRRAQYLPGMRDLLDRLRSVPEAMQPCTLAGTWRLSFAGRMVSLAVVILVMSIIVIAGSLYISHSPAGSTPSAPVITFTVTPIPAVRPTRTSVPPTRMPTSTFVVAPAEASFRPVQQTPEVVRQQSVADNRPD